MGRVKVVTGKENNLGEKIRINEKNVDLNIEQNQLVLIKK